MLTSFNMYMYFKNLNRDRPLILIELSFSRDNSYSYLVFVKEISAQTSYNILSTTYDHCYAAHDFKPFCMV